MMTRRWHLWMFGAVALVLAMALAWWAQRPRDPSSATAAPGQTLPTQPAPQTPSVDVAQVELVKVIDDAQAVGSLRSRRSVVLRPEISGRVVQLNFRDGERVRKGQSLVQLDDQLPLAQVQQSRAELSIAQANHSRNQELVAQGFISQRSVDESAASLEVARARLALAQASLARLKILAPFDGTVGIRLVNVGDYLKDGADIVNLEDADAVYVDFRLPERYQGQIHKGQTAGVVVDAVPAMDFRAVIQAVDPLIDANGRSVGVRGCIDNRHQHLRPGMFARVTVVFGERDHAMVVPEEAIVPMGGKSFVMRLRPGVKASTLVSERVEVRLGVRQPGRVEVRDGLQPGDTVVTAGQQRLQRDGTEVRVMERAPAAVQTGAAQGLTTQAQVPNSPPGLNPCKDRNP